MKAFDILKTAGGFVAGVSACRVVTDAIEKCTDETADRHIVEKLVFKVGTVVIAGAVGAAVSRYVHKEIGEIETIFYPEKEESIVDRFIRDGWAVCGVSIDGLILAKNGVEITMPATIDEINRYVTKV